MRVFHEQPFPFWDENFLEFCRDELGQGEKYGVFLVWFYPNRFFDLLLLL